MMTLRIVLAFVLSIITLRTSADPLPKLILLTQSKGFAHDVVKHKDGQPSLVQKTFASIAEKSKLFELETTEDASTLTPEKLKTAKVVAFYTTGDIPLDVKAFDQWIQAGGGFLAVHTGTDTLHGNADYLKIVNAEFNGHPWTSKTTVTFKLIDPTNPTVSMFDPHYTRMEEIYHYKNFDPTQVRVLMSLDMERTELKRPEHVPVVWCKTYGQGKVFHTEFGHREDVWTSDVYQEHLTEAIKWLLGETTFDATPNPEVSKQEEELAKKAVAATQPATQANASTTAPSTAPATAPVASRPTHTPKVVDGFSITPFVQGPDIHSPCSIAVTPHGKVFVGEDEYNSGPDRRLGLSHIKLCVDTDGDGKADRITTFAGNINSPQGMCYAGGTLYVTHAPLFTALRDTDGDGVADQREDLITGLGGPPEGLVQHVPSGAHMGIDGWLYITIGDKGIQQAIGKDGRRITLHGGGIVRIRPDGTDLEIFCTGTRNIFDVALDPYLNAFTRDNTNDGDGWWSRLTQMQRDAFFGYPSFYKNFGDEMLQPMADYGSGGATGSIYIHEPNLPGDYGDCLYTTDWARGIVYRHQLKPDGASFYPNQLSFITDIYSTHTDVDGMSRIYCADWARRDWNTSTGVGAVYLIRANATSTTAPTTNDVVEDSSHGRKSVDAPDDKDASIASNVHGLASVATTNPSDPWPDLHAMSVSELVEQLANRSAVRRREAQLELLHRQDSDETNSLVKFAISKTKAPLYARVAELFTLAQIAGEKSHPMISGWIDDADLREFVLRALVDRDEQLSNVDPRLFADALTDPNPRVRVQAAIGLGRLRDPSFNEKLVPLTADKDWNVRHAAMQSLRELSGTDACIAAIGSSDNPKLIAGAMMVLRSEHDRHTVMALEHLLAKDSRTIVHHEAIVTLARLYQVEATWDGSWWNTRPDTRGPNYKAAAWSESGRVAQMMIRLADDPDLQTRKDAIAMIGLVGMGEAVPMLGRLVSTDNPLRNDAAGALVQMKSPDAIAALEKIATNSTFDVDLRTKAAAAIGAADGADAQAAVIRMLAALDGSADPSQPVLDKLTTAVTSHAATDDQGADLINLTKQAKQRATRIAAAESLLRGSDQSVKDRVAKLWDESDDKALDALLAAAATVPADQIKPYQAKVEAQLQARQDEVRHDAMVAVGHVGDSTAVKLLLDLAAKQVDRLAAASALAEIAPDIAPDDQVLAVAQLLTSSTSALARSPDRDAYSKVLAAAEKFAADKRIPVAEAEKLLVTLKRQGVIYSYLRTDAIPAPAAATAFTFVCPPEQTPAGPFTTFTVADNTYTWKPLNITDPQGIAQLDLPGGSVEYLTTTVDSPAACTGYLTAGSDDGIQAWLNGTKVMTIDKSRSVKADENRSKVQLLAGKNTLLFKVNNNTGPSGIQARVRWKPSDFEPQQLVDYISSMPTNVEKGKEIFTTLGCVKCHTLSPHEEPKGPYLGDVGTKFDAKYIVESILRPSAKIAQGFSTVRVVATDANGKGSTEYLGFITKESGDEIQMRDLTGKVMTVNKSHITTRQTRPESMMPEGLTDGLSLEDFRSLLAYLQSLKGGK